ncbi:mRNA interferase PemK [Cnuibacter physcomitrellae]|uniref:Uncharacterized protein n=1 Tax=Cnuibacter physcomitrellae TaxID=1619308 RepID=A0A1X9LJ61_9MICO|nr:type II toxin-antitoxin system PemK/MazF family toxin [Cnuibacter physcomitrellae]ARJ05224.1 hypothetical protein B5808_08360 [Cnuibacter physcomitrellae]GGI35221.1 mRNA interferase PemK [Cnuibacter physcomitrellae]
MRAPREGDDSPGRSGRWATTEVDPQTLRGLSILYSPRTDGRADPGEVVWTWVPYEEHDGRGKDRPVLVVASLPDSSLVGVQLTSKPHDDRWTIGIGPGAWDSSGRPSWVRLDRVFLLHQAGLRRAGVALDAARFRAVSAELARRHGWPAVRPRRRGLRGLLSRLLGRA